MVIVFLGVPGSGKGTQAKRLAQEMKIAYVGTGDILRDNVARKTPLGIKVAEIMKSGKLVDDETMIELIKEEIKDKDSFILDGFPRTVAQADALSNLLSQFGKSIGCVIFLDVSDEEVIRRITGRVFCRNCRREFNIYTDDLKNGKCPVCGGELVKRSDDTPETVKARILEYRSKTAPLINYYASKNVLEKINGSGTIDAVFSGIREVLNDKYKG